MRNEEKELTHLKKAIAALFDVGSELIIVDEDWKSFKSWVIGKIEEYSE